MVMRKKIKGKSRSGVQHLMIYVLQCESLGWYSIFLSVRDEEGVELEREDGRFGMTRTTEHCLGGKSSAGHLLYLKKKRLQHQHD